MADGEDKRPPPPAWINEEFIETALRSGDQDQTITVLSIEVKQANAIGDNYGSDMYRVSCEVMSGYGTPETRSVIVKCHPQGGMIEELLSNADSFSRESKILTETLPAMFQLLEEASPGKYQPFGARCLYYGENPIKFIVIEDLKPLGFRMAERRRGLDLQHCLLAIKTLAQFHAASTALLVNDPTVLDKHGGGVYSEHMRDTLCTFTTGGICSLASVVETWPEFRAQKYAERILALKDTFYDRLMEVCGRKEDGWNTLVHYDPWVNNIMFKYSEENLEALRLVDFQSSCRGSPSIDLLYFLHTSPTEEVRVDHMDHLLREYVAEYNAVLEDLNCGEKRISFKMLEEAMEENGFFAFYASISALPIVLADPKDGFDLESLLQDSDENSGNNNKVYTSEVYVRVIRRLLPVFDKKGFF